MKKTVLAVSRFVPALLVAVAFSGITFAQKSASPQKKSETNTNEVNVRIIERDGDDVREIERTYHTNGMDDPQRDKMVTKLVDSLKATRKGKGRQQMTIIVEDNNGNSVVTRQRTSPGKLRAPNELYGPKARPSSPRDPQAWSYNFRYNFDSLADRMNRFKFEFPRDFDRQIARPFEDWSRNFNGKASTIRGLDAFPNNPDRDQLNVRFTAPTKGDVSIIVTNPKGKEVAKREIKDFSGEFVGQIDLGKKAQGTYFITVTQNEDGAVKRIVVE